MKLINFAAVVFSMFGAGAYAQSLDGTHSCVMVYLKHDATQPNLTVACDGERILTHIVKTEDQLEDPANFHAELYKAFQVMVNSSGRKECKEYDDANFWWASCLERQ